MKNFLGCHSEWNLGSPGGWEYQRITQELGKLFWKRVCERVKINVPLDFDHVMFKPVIGFADTLLRAHKRNFASKSPHVVLTAEPDTLDTVVENKNFVERMDKMPGVSAALAPPQDIVSRNSKLYCQDREVTVIFQDFNADVLLELEKDLDLTGLRAAIKAGLVVNPKGMEPVGIKSVFEVVSGEFKDKLHESTVARTPWTRMLFDRATTGPKGEDIPDFLAWVRENFKELVLKPVQGYSGKGVIVGYNSKDPERDLQAALKVGNYIAQELIPLTLWGEDSPWLENGRIVLKRWQTDFRCLVTDAGVIGFLARFGGVPTNVGSGGGTQPLAALPGNTPTREAVTEVNKAVLSLPYPALSEIKQEVDERAVAMGNTYLLGPIPLALRPRILNEAQIKALCTYGENLWRDCVTLVKLWREGALGRTAKISDPEKAVADMAPWSGEPAMLASDGLFSFGGHPEEADQDLNEIFSLGKTPHEGF